MTRRGGVKILDGIEVRWNLEIDMFDRGKRRRHHQRTHNIVVNTGRQYLCETITASTFSPVTRHSNHVIRYVGFGIGGTRQTSSSASSAPYSTAYPGGYGGTNAQTDTDAAVAGLERPVRVTNSPSDLFFRQVSTPGTFPTAVRTRFIAVFGPTDINYGSFTSVPLSEIGLYTSVADPALPNGVAGAYPGSPGALFAYDTFDTIHKTGGFSIEVRWELRFG